MKITQTSLKKIIKEEIEALEEMGSADPVVEALQETLKLIESIEWDNELSQKVTYDYQKAARRLRQKVQAALAGMR
jgi:hypothetical protein